MAELERERAPFHRYAHVDRDPERWDGFVPRSRDIHVRTCHMSGATRTRMIATLLVLQTPDLPQPLNENSPRLDLVTDAREAAHARLAARTRRRILKARTSLDGLQWHASAKRLVVARDPRGVFASMVNLQENADPETERALAAEMGNDATVSDLLAATEEDRPKEWLTCSLLHLPVSFRSWWRYSCDAGMLAAGEH